jgi:hypothetical protein
MNANYLFLFPVIYAAMCVYLAILVAVTRKRAAQKRNSHPSTPKRKASLRIEPRSGPEQLGVEGH